MEGSQHTVTGWPGPGRPAHARHPRRPPGTLPTVVLAGAVVLAALGAVAAACLSSHDTSKSTPPSASLITVLPPVTPTLGPVAPIR